jgi:hypothetical protein
MGFSSLKMHTSRGKHRLQGHGAAALQLDNAPPSVNRLFTLQSAKARLPFELMKYTARMRSFLWQGKHSAPGLPNFFAFAGVFPYFPVV